MFLLSSFNSIEADLHRDRLLAEATESRIAGLAKAGRRRATRRNAPPARPPVETRRPQQNSDADRRYAVSR